MPRKDRRYQARTKPCRVVAHFEPLNLSSEQQALAQLAKDQALADRFRRGQLFFASHPEHKKPRGTIY